MSFTPQTITDKNVQYPHRYQLTEVSAGVYDLTAVPGTITEAGTAVNKALLQRYEDTLGVIWDAYVPTGAMLWWPMEDPPTGWFECDGSAISRTTYSALFAKIGTVHGAGDGSTTFNLPDSQNYFIRGWDHVRTFGGAQDATSVAFNSTATESTGVSVKNSDGTDGTVSVNRNTNSASNTTKSYQKMRPQNKAYLLIIKY